MTPHTTTTLTPTTMTPPPPLATAPVPPDQYNALVHRLDQELLTRTQLQADLAAARDQAAYLQTRLASMGADQLPPAPRAPKQEPRIAPREKQDKEILSHCSDISAVRSPDMSAKPFRKSASSLIVKKKGKKERAPKVKIPGQSRYWTPEEHKLFLEALNKYGHKDLRSISSYVGTRNMTQVRTHSQKYFMRLMREAKRQNPANKLDEKSHDKHPPTPDATPIASATCTKPTSAGSERAESKHEPKHEPKHESGDKYSVPNTCGMTLLCLVGQDTLPV